MWPATDAATHRRSWSTRVRSSSTWTGAARSMVRGAPDWMPMPRAAPRRSSRSSGPRRVGSSVPRAHRCWPRRPRICAPSGSRRAWSRPVAPERPLSDGPMPMPIRRHWENVHSSRTVVPCRSASCVPPSSNPPSPSRCRGGSGASAWPSRSSSVTHADSSSSSPASPRASSMSSPWISSPPRSSPWPPRVPNPSPKSSRWPRDHAIHSTTADSSTSSATGSANTRSMTPRGNPSWCPSGRSPAAAMSRNSCVGPRRR